MRESPRTWDHGSNANNNLPGLVPAAQYRPLTYHAPDRLKFIAACVGVLMMLCVSRHVTWSRRPVLDLARTSAWANHNV